MTDTNPTPPTTPSTYILSQRTTTHIGSYATEIKSESGPEDLKTTESYETALAAMEEVKKALMYTDEDHALIMYEYVFVSGNETNNADGCDIILRPSGPDKSSTVIHLRIREVKVSPHCCCFDFGYSCKSLDRKYKMQKRYL